jgi:alpha-glucoside transport system substrate-binding protein
MNKRVWLIISMLTIAAMLVAACAPADPVDTTPEVPAETPAQPPAETPVQPPADTPAAPADTPTSPPAETPVETPVPTPGDDDQIGGTVSVLAVWGGEELDSFRAMVAPFEQQTGITVAYEGTRDLNAVLTTRVQGGNPPDLAGLPGPGQLQEFAQAGHLVPLDDVLDMQSLQQQYDEGFLQLATYNGQLYGIFTKADVKSLVWYSPPAFESAGYEVPTTWQELQALEEQIIADGAAPWCIGLESGAASGWPGTDWIEDIMLRTAGPDVYDQWWQHEIEWTSEPVRNAWETWGEIVGDPSRVYGGPQTVLTTNFGESPFPMFEDQPGCYMHRQAGFITTFIQEQYPDLQAGQDYDFFTFPAIDEQHGTPLLVAGDLFGMFNDTPQARALMEYLVTAEAQSIWAERGGFLSANRTVDPEVYPDQLTQQIAEMLAEAPAVRFDASDLMPEAVNNAFWSGILDFVSNPGQLDTSWQKIESTAQGAYQQ